MKEDGDEGETERATETASANVRMQKAVVVGAESGHRPSAFHRQSAQLRAHQQTAEQLNFNCISTLYPQRISGHLAAHCWL